MYSSWGSRFRRLTRLGGAAVAAVLPLSLAFDGAPKHDKQPAQSIRLSTFSDIQIQVSHMPAVQVQIVIDLSPIVACESSFVPACGGLGTQSMAHTGSVC